ncbi:MAG: AAA family ATPase [Opitutales bacterium]
MADHLQGTLERIVFSNEETHYTVARLKVPGERELVSVVGKLPGVQCGELLELTGAWERDREHGRQFRVEAFESRLPGTVQGIKRYLGSGLVRNVGPKFAAKIVDHFGKDTLEVISDQSGRLREVPGVGEQRAKAIKAAWDEQRALRDVLLFLQQYGVGTALCLKLVRTYGSEAAVVLRNDPYRVAREVRGIGFATADKIALNLGFKTDSAARLEAGLLFALSDFEEQGHTGADAFTLAESAATLLGARAETLLPHLEALAAKGLLLVLETDNTKLYQLPATAGAERAIAESLRELLEAPSCFPPIQVDKAVEWAQERAGFTFAPEQAEGVRQALARKVSIITGGPGTGKTTILRAVVDILRAKRVKVLAAAPTGRAAQRLSESAGLPGYTLHRLVMRAEGKGPQPGQQSDNPGTIVMREPPPHLGETGCLIVDETSMVDTPLAARTLRHLNRRAHLLLVGDTHQLPSVGPGNVLGDLIAYGMD